MYLLSTDKVELVTTGTATLAVLTSWEDLELATGDVTPGRTPTLISTAATTDISGSPASGFIRHILSIHVKNYDAVDPATPALQLDVSATDYPIADPLLGAGEKFVYTSDGGVHAFDAQGRLKTSYIDARIVTKTLLADQSNATSTPTEVTGLTVPCGPGVYQWTYMARLQSPVSTTGHKLSVNHDGTVTDFTYNRRWVDISPTAATAAPDQDSVVATATVMAAWSARAKSTAGLGATLSVDTVNVDMMEILEGRMTVTVAGNLELWHGAEVTATATIKAGSSLVLIRTD